MSPKKERQDIFGNPFRRQVPISTDKTESIHPSLFSPHYSDPRFAEGPQTVFLDPEYNLSENGSEELVEGAHYNDSDRYNSWYGYDVVQEAWSKAHAEGHPENSPALVEAWLQLVHKDPTLKLVHIMTYFHRANGFPIRCYGFITK